MKHIRPYESARRKPRLNEQAEFAPGMFIFKEKIEGVDYYVVKDSKGTVIAKSQDQQAAMQKAKSKARAGVTEPQPEQTTALAEMAILPRKEMPARPIEIDLSGPEGNAFNLIGLAKSLYRKIYPERIEEHEEQVKELLSILDDAVKSGIVTPSERAAQLKSLKASSPIDLMVREMTSGDYVILYR